jgi:hypothetical protein
MSKYQYYEFQAIDKPLTEAEQQKISSLSNRVELTAMTAKFVYNSSKFPENAEKILAQYFDAMLYVTNWGTRQLMFRLPKSVVNIDELAPYCISDIISTYIVNNHIILDIHFQYECGEYTWLEGENCLPSLALLRRDILRGDLRVLYLAWLGAAVEYGDDENQLEPPIPANLDTLSAPLKDFVNLFEIAQYLIKVAVSNSITRQTDSVLLTLEKWVEKLPVAERNHFLVQLAKGETNIDIQLLNRLRELATNQSTQPPVKQRTVATLIKSQQEEIERVEKKPRKADEKAKKKELESFHRFHRWLFTIHIQPLSGLGQTGSPVLILSYRVSQKMYQPR